MAYSYPAAQVFNKFLVTFVGKQSDQTIMSTFWYLCTGLTGAPTVETVMDALITDLSAAGKLQSRYRTITPDNYTLNEVWCQVIDPIRFAKKVYLRALAGVAGTDSTTPNVCAVLTRRAVQATKKAISTLHVPCSTSNGAIVDGLLTAGLRADMAALGTEVIRPINIAGVASLAPIVRNGPGNADWHAIEGYIVEPEAREMSRRTVGRGI